MRIHQTIPMVLKHWASAGLCVTDWCSSSCELCYMCCSPKGKTWMTPDEAIRIWSQLRDVSPRGCRVHVTGGEVFGNWELLIEILNRAHSEGLTPLEKVETNAFWATDDKIIRDRIKALDAAGMQKLGISADPFHQQFVPIEFPQRLAKVAAEILGPGRVQVRWDVFLNSADPLNFDLDNPSDSQRKSLAEWISARHERLTGRAGEALAPHLPLRDVESFRGQNCRQGLMRGKHVHIFPQGHIFPGVCAGIVLGNTAEMSIPEIRKTLKNEYSSRPVLGALVRGGPVELMQLAQAHGFCPEPGYASQCHLCWKIRKFLADAGCFSDELAPAEMYENAGFQT